MRAREGAKEQTVKGHILIRFIQRIDKVNVDADVDVGASGVIPTKCEQLCASDYAILER